MEAEINAKNKITLAQAEAKSIIEVGNAELEISSKKLSLPYPELRLMTESQVKCLEGVQKVIYTDKQPFLIQGLTAQALNNPSVQNC